MVSHLFDDSLNANFFKNKSLVSIVCSLKNFLNASSTIPVSIFLKSKIFEPIIIANKIVKNLIFNLLDLINLTIFSTTEFKNIRSLLEFRYWFKYFRFKKNRNWNCR